MKNLRKLVPAIAMLMVSVILLSTASFAWFSMNTQVTASGMQVKAQAEGGIVIANDSDSDAWNASATAQNSQLAELIPTSTADAIKWYHSTSTDANDANKGQSAVQLSVTPNGGLGNTTLDGATKSVYLLNTFYIKSSAESISLASTDGLYINSVNVELPNSPRTTNLNKALRVAIVIDDGTSTAVTKIFAPVSGGETSYKVNGVDTTAIAAGTQDTATGLKTIPAYTSTNPITVSVYVYFEGEDTNCKSANLASAIDELKVSVVFGTTKVST